MRALVAAGAAALLLAGCSSGGHRAEPKPTTHTPVVDDSEIQRLHGIPLLGRLDVSVVDGNKLVDLDTHRTQQIVGLPRNPNSVIEFRVSTTRVLSVDDRPFVLSKSGLKARPIAGAVSSVAAGLNGIWLTRGRDSCKLTEISTTGRTITPARPINCDYQIYGETRDGLIAGTGTGEVLLDHRLRPTVHSELIAIAGKTLISTDGDRIDVSGSGTVRLPDSVGALDGLYVSPDNAYVAVEFGNPACPGPRQCLDIWMLRMATMSWSHPPSMPVAMYLKPHNLFWSRSGRFTWLGTFDGVGDAIATWQPGATALRMRQISLPASQYGVLPS
jgi:hypothetical protein